LIKRATNLLDYNRAINYIFLSRFRKANREFEDTYYTPHPERWHCRYLLTSRNYRGFGAGTLLLKWGMEQAARECYVDAYNPTKTADTSTSTSKSPCSCDFDGGSACKLRCRFDIKKPNPPHRPRPVVCTAETNAAPAGKGEHCEEPFYRLGWRRLGRAFLPTVGGIDMGCPMVWSPPPPPPEWDEMEKERRRGERERERERERMGVRRSMGEGKISMQGNAMMKAGVRMMGSCQTAGVRVMDRSGESSAGEATGPMLRPHGNGCRHWVWAVANNWFVRPEVLYYAFYVVLFLGLLWIKKLLG
jgi:hypothetical protein